MQRAFLGALTMVTLGLLVSYLIETSGGNQMSLDAKEMKRLKDSIGSVSNQQLEDMINMACESVQPDTESEEFCYKLRWEMERRIVELELRKRGEIDAAAIREEFEERGRILEAKIR